MGWGFWGRRRGPLGWGSRKEVLEVVGESGLGFGRKILLAREL